MRLPERTAYRDARGRCTNPKCASWPNYGGRGIKFLFANFEQFLAEVGARPTPRHSLDRINSNGDYEPGNIRWATRSQQNKNKRYSTKSESCRKKLSASAKARGTAHMNTPAARSKKSLALRGRKVTAKTRALMSASAKARALHNPQHLIKARAARGTQYRDLATGRFRRGGSTHAINYQAA